MHVAISRGRVAIRDLFNFLATDLGQVVKWAILSDGLEEGIDHWVGVSLSALDPETTVEEASVYKHLPNDWMAPIVRLLLGIDGEAEVVVTSF